MIIHISQNACENQIDEITQFVESMGLNAHRSNGSNRIILGLTGDVSKVDVNTLKKYHIVEGVYRITAPYKKANLSLIHISEPTRLSLVSRMPSSA